MAWCDLFVGKSVHLQRQVYWFTVEAHLWPHFHGLSLSLESTNPSVGTRLKVRLACLELEAKKKESKDELEFKLK